MEDLLSMRQKQASSTSRIVLLLIQVNLVNILFNLNQKLTILNQIAEVQSNYHAGVFLPPVKAGR